MKIGFTAEFWECQHWYCVHCYQPRLFCEKSELRFAPISALLTLTPLILLYTFLAKFFNPNISLWESPNFRRRWFSVRPPLRWRWRLPPTLFASIRMLTIKRVPTVVSNYQQEDDSDQGSLLGCGRNCLGQCCLPGMCFLWLIESLCCILLIMYLAGFLYSVAEKV